MSILDDLLRHASDCPRNAPNEGMCSCWPQRDRLLAEHFARVFGASPVSRGAPTPAMIDDLQHLEILLSQAGVDDGSSQFDHVITARYIKRALEMVAALRAALTAPEGQP